MYHLKHISSVASLFLAGYIFLKFTYIKLTYNGLGFLHFVWEYIRYVSGRMKLKVKKYYVPPPPPPPTHPRIRIFKIPRFKKCPFFFVLVKIFWMRLPHPPTFKNDATYLPFCM